MMGWAGTARTLALPILAACSLGGCVETRPLIVTGVAPKGPATYQIIGAELLASPVRAALEGQLTSRGLKPSDDESADYFISLSFADRPLGIGTFGGDKRPPKADSRWIDDPVRSGKREQRMMIRFADKTGAVNQSLTGIQIVPRRSPPAKVEALVQALFVASQ